VRAIDTFCPIGYGQRLGIFAGAGVGKSTLLGMIARHADVDVCVIALVGERGREVQEFIHECLGEEGLARSVVVVATSDESPLRRLIAPQTATSIAEYYRAQGLRVLLLVDSLTRTARAIREVELAAGEPPVRQGYTSGVYTELPRLLERAGNDDSGSITALYTVLTTGEQDSDPLADEIKSILDGHLVLSQQVQLEGIRPAIDVLRSVSRLREKLQSEEVRVCMENLLTVLGRLRRDRDIVLLGGSPDPALRTALRIEPELKRFLSQRPKDHTTSKELHLMLEELSKHYLDTLEQSPRPSP
jgi:FliI/YscN family ATPase